MGGRGRIVAGVVAALLVTACGTDPTPTVADAVSPAPTPGATTTAPADDASTDPDAASFGAAEDCEALHAAVLAHLDDLAARARAELGDTTVVDAIEDMARAESAGELPDAFQFLDGLAPMAPYGGIAGDGAVARYAQLGCTPDDEYAALAGWFGVPADADESALEAAATPMLEGGADGAVALALARRLLEGDPDSADAVVLEEALRAAAEAQQAVRDRTGSYTESVPQLVEAGLPATYDDVMNDVFVMVLAADADAYCMTAAAERGVAYVESHDHVPVVESRSEPGLACAATFPELD